MPEDFHPHSELVKIETLHEMIKACRERTTKTFSLIDEIFDSPEVSYETKLRAIDMVWNRGYGKAIQQVRITGETSNDRRVQIYIPDNGRPNTSAPTIDAEVDNV